LANFYQYFDTIFLISFYLFVIRSLLSTITGMIVVCRSWQSATASVVTGVDLAGILGDTEAEPERLVGGERWGVLGEVWEGD